MEVEIDGDGGWWRMRSNQSAGADEMAEEESEAVWEATKTKGSRVTASRACPKFQCQGISSSFKLDSDGIQVFASFLTLSTPPIH